MIWVLKFLCFLWIQRSLDVYSITQQKSWGINFWKVYDLEEHGRVTDRLLSWRYETGKTLFWIFNKLKKQCEAPRNFFKFCYFWPQNPLMCLRVAVWRREIKILRGSKRRYSVWKVLSSTWKDLLLPKSASLTSEENVGISTKTKNLSTLPYEQVFWLKKRRWVFKNLYFDVSVDNVFTVQVV